MAKAQINFGELGGGGGEPITLWEDTTLTQFPSGSQTTGTITLSDGMSNYSRIRIKLKSPNSFTSYDPMEFDIDPAVWATYPTNCDLSLGKGNGRARRVSRTSDTVITMTRCFEIGGTGVDYTTCVPIGVYGIK